MSETTTPDAPVSEHAHAGDGTEFRLPSLGSDMERGTILAWRVGPGDVVHKGDVVLDVDTDKAEIEVEVWYDAVVAELLVQPGAEVPVGTPLALLTPLERDGLDLAEVERDGLDSAEIERAPATASPVLTPPVEQPTAVAASIVETVPTPRTVYWPSGDMSPAKHRRISRPLSTTSEGLDADASRGQTSRMRSAVGNLMARSNTEIPHYHLSSEVDLGALTAWLEEKNRDAPVTERVLPAAAMLRAVALAAKAHPVLNGYWKAGAFQPATGVHVGVAIHLRQGGLVAPAIMDADALPIDELMVRLQDLVARARGGGLRSSEMTAASITVTNLGDQGADAVSGLIHPPQVALVGFGRVSDRPLAVAGTATVRPGVTVTLAADHRATDGHVGGRFLSAIAKSLEHPEEL